MSQKRNKRKKGKGVNHGRPRLRKLRKKRTKRKKVSAAALRKKKFPRKKRKGVKQARPRLKRINKAGESAIAETVIRKGKPVIRVRGNIKGEARKVLIAHEKEHIRDAKGKDYRERHPSLPHKTAKINRGMIAKAIKESARVKIEYTRGDKTCYRETKFKVQPAFIDEYLDRIIIGIEQNIPLICEEVLAKGRKTLMVKEGNGINDVVNFFDRNGNNTLAREPLKKTPPDVPWIKNGRCINKGQSICNLGYACDGCPWNFDKQEKESKGER